MNGTTSNSIIHNFLSNLITSIANASSIVITAHNNADPDALASAMGLKEFFNLVLPKKKIEIILQLNKLAEKVYNELLSSNPKWKISKEYPENIDLLVMVDVWDLEMVAIPKSINDDGKEPNINQIIVIDHHITPIKLDTRVKHSLILSEYSSAAEIITKFFQIKNLIPSREIVMVLLSGIITDTGHFRYATKDTLDNAKFLLETGVSISDVTEHLNKKIDRSERIARIRSAMRINKLFYLGNYIIAISHVSSYEASAAKALIDLGVDVSFIISFENKSHKFRISSRANFQILKKTSLHLGEVMALIGEKFNGSGGGHAGAAGCYGILKINKSKNDDNYMELLIPEILKLIKNRV